MTREQIAKIFGCTPQQVKAQFSANAEQLYAMATKASATGKKVNGYTAAQLTGHAKRMAAK